MQNIVTVASQAELDAALFDGATCFIVDIADDYASVIVTSGHNLQFSGSSKVTLLNNTSALLFDNAHAEMYDNSSAAVFDNASVALFDFSSANLHNNAHAELFDNASVGMFDNSVAMVNDATATVSAHDNATVIEA